MNRDTADVLAKRIINCWRGGPPLVEWIDELERLDEGPAGTTFVRLRRSIEHAPSIARFMAEYNSLHTDDASTRGPVCGWCDNTGWTQTRPHQAHGVAYSGVEPCDRCDEGRARRNSDAWTKSAPRDFISDAEATRLETAEQQRHKPTRKVDA